MNRLEFMKQLARLLDDLPREEKIEILKYYNGYFDDAGAENEEEIIAQLGSPEKVAAEVKAGMELDFAGEQAETFGQETCAQEENVFTFGQTGEQTSTKTEQAEDTSSYEEEDTSSNVTEGRSSYEYESQPPIQHKKRNKWMILAVIAGLLVTFPVWIGLLGMVIGLLGSLLGLFGGAIGVIVSLVVGLFSLLIGLVGGAVGCVVSGVTMLLTAPITGVLSLAVGIFLLGLLLLVGLLIGLIFGKIVPGIVSGIGKLIRGVGKAVGGIFDGITGRR